MPASAAARADVWLAMLRLIRASERVSKVKEAAIVDSSASPSTTAINAMPFSLRRLARILLNLYRVELSSASWCQSRK